MKVHIIVKFIEESRRWWFPGADGERKLGSYGLMAMEFQFWNEKGPDMGGVNGCAMMQMVSTLLKHTFKNSFKEVKDRKGYIMQTLIKESRSAYASIR